MRLGQPNRSVNSIRYDEEKQAKEKWERRRSIYGVGGGVPSMEGKKRAKEIIATTKLWDAWPVQSTDQVE